MAVKSRVERGKDFIDSFFQKLQIKNNLPATIPTTEKSFGTKLFSHN